MTWLNQFTYNPLEPLLQSDDYALNYFAQRDLMRKQVEPIDTIWQLTEVQKLFKKQQSDGSFKSTNQNQYKYPDVNYSLIETWKQFRFLIQKYEFTNKVPAVEKAAEYLFSCQTDEGDFRGFLAGQYAMYYSGAIMGLLIQAGYQNDPRIEKGFQWLLKMRQDDGGWVGAPFQTLFLPRKKLYKLVSEVTEPLQEHDRTKPSSPHWTGMVIRAFAAHPEYSKSEAARHAAHLLKSKFFQKDFYTSYQHPDNWVNFNFPFWWNNLVSALDSLWRLDFAKDDKDIKRGLDWLLEHQQPSGLWKNSYSAIHKATVTEKAKQVQLWISLAICRIFKRFC
ncbi:MAG: terpene cyclase/mutase family protein [Spirochaetales bacterium]|nr:terpene cyclase/mutase family protein [Spirochaetales bacterium]